MDDTIELVVDTRELDAALKALPLKMQGKIMREALQAGGDTLAECLESYTPERTDEETPEGTSLPPGILKADIKTEIQLGNGTYPPRIKVGFTKISRHVARWQNDGWNLTKGGQRHVGKDGRVHGNGKIIRVIPGKHFIEAAFDESAESAIGEFLDKLAERLIDDPASKAE